MSSSKQSSNHSNTSKSGLDEINIFNEFVPSKIFSIEKYPLVQPELNRKIAKLTNPKTLNYTTDIAKIIRVLRDREVVEYQHSLMEAAIDNISETTVDIDRIRIGLNLTQNDIDKLLDKKSGFHVIRNSGSDNRRTNLRVDLSSSSLSINRGFAYNNADFSEEYIVPFYTNRYEMFVDGDDYRVINVYVADIKNQYNEGRRLRYNCVIDFIPTRVGAELVSYMLYQFHSVLEVNRYNSLMKNALLLELHTGYIMYGVSQLFSFILTNNKSRTASTCMPKSKKRAKETTYIGERYHHRCIAYDKVLKENKVFVKKCLKRSGSRSRWKDIVIQLPGYKEWFPSQVCSYRVESRKYFDPVDKILLKDIGILDSLLCEVQLIKPIYLAELKDDELEALIMNKRLPEVKKLRDRIEKKYGEGTACFEFERVNLDVSLMLKLKAVLNAIFKPQKLLQPTKGNYRKQVNTVHEFIKPIIESRKEVNDSKADIIAADKRAIYVEGCPGAGKTRLIVDRVKYLLDSGVKPTSITVLAYTRSAKKEFAARISKLGGDSKRVVVDTFSGWCNKLLNRLEGETKKGLDVPDAKEMLSDLIYDGGGYDDEDKAYRDAEKAYSILERMANFEKQSIGGATKRVNAKWVDEIETLQELFEAYKAKKTKCKKRDFNDMLLDVKQQLEDKTAKNRLKIELQHFIVDEAQDSNSTQWEITKQLYSAGINVFMVGDPAQAIFEFRGAKRHFMKKFYEVFPDKSERFQLRLNYRSTPSIVELGNAVRRMISTNFFASESAVNGVKDAKTRAKYCSDFDESLRWLVEDIKQHESDAPNQLILCRYRNHISKVNEALSNAGFDENRLKAVTHTYHGAKGLEADHCYVLDPLLDVEGLSSYKEELCNTYVAITRAKVAMTIIIKENGSAFYPETTGQGGKRESIFLKLPKNLLEIVD
ncbi:AAA family ATPase [Shewanella sp. JBTF-M18]|uniref:DNA 3'-5' helicase II n=1 Tax=Shewanella insulae TaxID=2681496 RepID=A0A6L7HU88_9GAMM|nr:DEAD/DEAH box helicase [Shewanella insulae]MXR67713.1 AAA family ATPase [Shewanella insulae]